MNVQKQHVWNMDDVVRCEKYKRFPHMNKANTLTHLY